MAEGFEAINAIWKKSIVLNNILQTLLKHYPEQQFEKKCFQRRFAKFGEKKLTTTKIYKTFLYVH